MVTVDLSATTASSPTGNKTEADRPTNFDLAGRPRTNPWSLLALLVPLAAAYGLAVMLRNVNNVLAPGIAQDFGLDPAALGALVGAYFIAGALIQFPLGQAIDRYGAATVQAAMLTATACGAVLSAVSTVFRRAKLTP